MHQHRTKPVLVCRGHAMYTPMLITGREAIFEFFAVQTWNVPKYIYDFKQLTLLFIIIII